MDKRKLLPYLAKAKMQAKDEVDKYDQGDKNDLFDRRKGGEENALA